MISLKKYFLVIFVLLVHKEGYGRDCFDWFLSYEKNSYKRSANVPVTFKKSCPELHDDSILTVFEFLDAKSCAISKRVARQWNRCMSNYLTYECNILRLTNSFDNTIEALTCLFENSTKSSQKLHQLAFSYTFSCQISTPLEKVGERIEKWRPYARLLKVLKQEKALSKTFRLVRSPMNANNITTLAILRIFELSDDPKYQKILLQALKELNCSEELHHLESRIVQKNKQKELAEMPCLWQGCLPLWKILSDCCINFSGSLS